MPKTDTSEAGLESLICKALTGAPCEPPKPGQPAEIAEATPAYGGAGWICGDPRQYDREFCVDLAQLGAFLHTTQPEVVAALDLTESSPTR